MKDFTLLKNAGMYTDLIYLLGYRFDKEEYLRRVSAYVDREKQEKKLDGILDRLQPIPEDIRIFCDPFVNKTVFFRNLGFGLRPGSVARYSAHSEPVREICFSPADDAGGSGALRLHAGAVCAGEEIKLS